jgi:hypothetical protein
VTLVAVAAPSNDPERKGLTLRGWLATHQRPTVTPTLEPLHFAPLEVSEAAFRSFFAGVPFEPIPTLRNDSFNGWMLEFRDSGEIFSVRVKPQTHREFTDPQLEISKLGTRWHEFNGVDSLRAAINLLSPIPF